MRSSLITFIVPVYNAEKYLTECLESILKQTDPDFEIILVDDGSTDGSADICDRYERNNGKIKVLHTENHGVGHARNMAIDLASGKYILFVDSDDVIHPQLAEKVRNCFESHKNTEIVCWKFTMFSDLEINWKFLKEKYTRTEKWNMDQMFQRVIDDERILGYAWNKAFLKSVLDDQVRFQEDIAVMEDLVFACEYLKHCDQNQEVIWIDSEMYGYRQIATSVLHSSFSEKKLTSLMAHDRVLEILEDSGMSADKINSYRNKMLRALCVMNKKLMRSKLENQVDWQNMVDALWLKHRKLVEYDDSWSFKERCYRTLLQITLKLRMEMRRKV